jgi:hypothetical protein
MLVLIILLLSESNIIKTTGTSSIGIFLYDSDNNKIINTNITTSGYSARGIILKGSNNNVTSCNITTTGSGTDEIETENTQWGGDDISSPIHISLSDNNRIVDCILDGKNYYDIFASGNSNQDNYLINSTLDKTDIKFNDSSNTKLYNQHYLSVYVNESLGNSVDQASVDLTDSKLYSGGNPTSTVHGETNSSGYMINMVLSEFLANETYNSTEGYLYFNNYTMNTSKGGFSTDSRELNVTKNLFEYVTLSSKCSGTLNPAYGDWLIDDNTKCFCADGEEIFIKGNIRVYSEGNLTLDVFIV